jgi:hypothetical protein
VKNAQRPNFHLMPRDQDLPLPIELSSTAYAQVKTSVTAELSSCNQKVPGEQNHRREQETVAALKTCFQVSTTKLFQ